ncbi:MAG: 2-oxo-4-hydroxy-4-carboxy-5-ureidoimidazoline decarboxylase [Porticoccaceae bacterium]|nr:2-oxo-4-hydroxy-4-carboxy-5-ureidoimidazoline decarboxylase [Porticoccaceae bacterium]
MSLHEVNTVDRDSATHIFMQCCTSKHWVEKMVADRPYNDFNTVRKAADQHWDQMTEHDYLEAFEGHPKIGDVSSLKAKYANTKALASGEQAGANQASDQIIIALADENRAYEEKYGFIFIVCATGKGAEDMLDLLRARLKNDRHRELEIASEEQRKIFHLRLEKLL